MMKRISVWMFGVLAVVAVLLVSGCIHADIGTLR